MSSSFEFQRANPSQGSRLSRGCGILFLALFLVLPLAMTAGFAFSVREGARAHYSYVEGVCTIVDKRLVENTDSDGDSTYRPEFTFELIADGQEYVVNGFNGVKVSSSGRSRKQAILDRYEVGETYPCFYDPDHPQKAVLEKPGWTSFLILLVPLGFIVIVLALLFLGRRRKKIRAFEKSTPRHAAAASGHVASASERSAPSTVVDGGAPFLGPIPDSRPGNRLVLRLGQAESEKAGAVALFLFGIAWTGFSAWAFLQARGDGDGCAVAFLGLFVLVGLAVLAAGVRQALVAWGTGKTVLEISRAELSPGESFQALIEQHGHMHANVIEARLLCREKATYRQGTDTRTATEDIVDLPLTKVENVRVAGQLARQFEGQVPESAMHSFKADHNEIEWRIVVTGDIERWPDFKRSFRLRVLPGGRR